MGRARIRPAFRRAQIGGTGRCAWAKHYGDCKAGPVMASSKLGNRAQARIAYPAIRISAKTRFGCPPSTAIRTDWPAPLPSAS